MIDAILEYAYEAWLYFWGILFLTWAFAGLAGAALVGVLSLNWHMRKRNR